MQKTKKSNIIENTTPAVEISTEYKKLETACKTPIKGKGVEIATKVCIEKFPANLSAWQDYFESESALVEFIEKQIVAHKVFSAARQAAQKAYENAEKLGQELPTEYTFEREKLEHRQPAEKSIARQVAEKFKTIDAEKLAQIKALLGL